MPGVVPYARAPLDERGNPRQRPEVGPEAVRCWTRADRSLDVRQLCGAQPRLAARAAGPFEPRAALRLPRVEPVVRADPRHAQRLGHRHLRFATREQPRGS